MNLPVRKQVNLPPLPLVNLDGTPSVPPDFLVVVIGAAGFAPAGVWRRLIEGSFPNTKILSLFIGMSEREVKGAYPPSLLSTVAVSDDPLWAQTAEGQSCFVCAVEGSLARVLALGPVNDPLWDAFEEAAY